ncbi:site-specific integrase [Metabacillus fastidiosus]|uniref:Site-specific integrase n=1 Tax=Metabacillus fastidiosus TaxID=1458 RepID=A0ABU6NRR8_9BACI|nr:site-specific integrase [Metabacillus fastidiosus]
MRGYVRKRGNKWSYTVDIGRDPITNKRKQKTKSGFDTEKEAQKALTEVIYELNKGIWIEPQKTILKDFAIDWMKAHRHQLRDTTAERYDININNWIIPLIGHYKVQELKPAHVQKFLSQLLEKVSENTAHKIHTLSKTIMDHAISLEIISKNPFRNITLTKGKKSEIETWSFDELEHFLNIVKKDNKLYYSMFVVAAYTGLRKGEVMALTRDDIDWEKQHLKITKSVSVTKKGVQVGKLKTPSSYRNVTIDDFLISILKERVAKNNEMKLKLGSEYQDGGFLFCHPDGKLFRPPSINKIMYRYIERSGVKKIRFHDLRHTHATLLLELGVNPKVVADRLGHSSVKITLDTYTHVSLNLQADVAETFSKRARNA